jgi:hypothetical protein
MPIPPLPPLPPIPPRVKKALEHYVKQMPRDADPDDISAMAYEKCFAAGFRPDLALSCEMYATEVHARRKKVPLGWFGLGGFRHDRTRRDCRPCRVIRYR